MIQGKQRYILLGAVIATAALTAIYFIPEKKSVALGDYDRLLGQSFHRAVLFIVAYSQHVAKYRREMSPAEPSPT